MLEEMLGWLNSMTPKEKNNLINNLKEFQRLKTYLEAKKVVIKDQKTGDFLIIKNHKSVEEFLVIYKKLTMKGVVVIDKRK